MKFNNIKLIYGILLIIILAIIVVIYEVFFKKTKEGFGNDYNTLSIQKIINDETFKKQVWNLVEHKLQNHRLVDIPQGKRYIGDKHSFGALPTPHNKRTVNDPIILSHFNELADKVTAVESTLTTHRSDKGAHGLPLQPDWDNVLSHVDDEGDLRHFKTRLDMEKVMDHVNDPRDYRHFKTQVEREGVMAHIVDDTKHMNSNFYSTDNTGIYAKLGPGTGSEDIDCLKKNANGGFMNTTCPWDN
jgi:hypothetical protein